MSVDLAPSLPSQDEMNELITKVTEAVKKYMGNWDASHDFNHIKRVVGLSHEIYTELGPLKKNHSKDIITLGALLHDVGDRKYLQQGQDQATIVRDLLLELGAPPHLAERIQVIVLGVSYNSEVQDYEKVTGLLKRYPELAVVQDADRLDSIGAMGIGRVFAYGAAKEDRDLEGSMDMFDYKFYKLEGLMKTEPGRKRCQVAIARLRVFEGWWKEESKSAVVGAGVLGMEV